MDPAHKCIRKVGSAAGGGGSGCVCLLLLGSRGVLRGLRAALHGMHLACMACQTHSTFCIRRWVAGATARSSMAAAASADSRRAGASVSQHGTAPWRQRHVGTSHHGMGGPAGAGPALRQPVLNTAGVAAKQRSPQPPSYASARCISHAAAPMLQPSSRIPYHALCPCPPLLLPLPAGRARELDLQPRAQAPRAARPDQRGQEVPRPGGQGPPAPQAAPQPPRRVAQEQLHQPAPLPLGGAAWRAACAHGGCERMCATRSGGAWRVRRRGARDRGAGLSWPLLQLLPWASCSLQSASCNSWPVQSVREKECRPAGAVAAAAGGRRQRQAGRCTELPGRCRRCLLALCIA